MGGGAGEVEGFSESDVGSEFVCLDEVGVVFDDSKFVVEVECARRDGVIEAFGVMMPGAGVRSGGRSSV